MPVIKIHLEDEELSAIQRRAGELGITVQELAYGALNCSMSHIQEKYCRVRIDQAVTERGHDLPLWSDSARSVAIYEGQHDVAQSPGPKGAPLERNNVIGGDNVKQGPRPKGGPL
ncbi:MAG: hypothetical protein EXS39_02110 [Opitutaceae bacterium]|nr:hypothetical protein [Opitutaceae bacterium]